MLKKIVGLLGCVAITLTFTGCPQEEAATVKGPNEHAAEPAKENAEEKAAEAAAEGEEAKKKAEAETKTGE